MSYALAKADKEHLPWVVMVQGERVRSQYENVGVGLKGVPNLILNANPPCVIVIGLLWLLFSSDALKEGTISNILEDQDALLLI